MLKECSLEENKFLREEGEEAKFYLITRYRPQGMKGEVFDHLFDGWIRDLAPSISLHRDHVKNHSINWNEYEKRFFEEMKAVRSFNAMLRVMEESENEDVYVVCFCGKQKGKQCHRFLIQEEIEFLRSMFDVDPEDYKKVNESEIQEITSSLNL